MNRSIGFRQATRHPIGDLATAEPPLRSNGFDLSAASLLLGVLVDGKTQGFGLLLQIDKQIAPGKNFRHLT